MLRPNYWINFAWKRLVGQSVLSLNSSNPNVRAYAFTGPPPSPYAEPACLASHVQLILINLEDTQPVQASPLPLLTGMEPDSITMAWVFTPGPSSGSSGEDITLNDELLPSLVNVDSMDPSSFLQYFIVPPVEGSAAEGIILPPLSTAFLCY